MTETENQSLNEEIEVLDDFEIESLIVEGTDAVIQREIIFFDIKDQKKKKMPVYLKPLSHSQWNQKVQTVTKNNTKNLEQLICAEGLVYPDGINVDLSKIKEMQKGVVSAIYEEIKIISGQFEDRMEEKFLEKMANL